MRTISPTEEAEYKGALSTAVLFVVAVIAAQTIAIFHESAFRRSVGERFLAFRLSHITFSIVVLAIVVIYGHRLSTGLIKTVPLLLVVPAFPLSWLTHVVYSRADIRYSPFLGYKLIFLLLSLAPGPGVTSNAILISGFATEAVALWYLGGVGESQHGTLSAEPWVTLLFAGASILILILQSAYRRMHRQLGELTVRQRLTEDLTRLSLAVRDRINSPLQTLEICFEVLPKDDQVAAAGRKSLNRIEESIRPLREFDCLVQWEQKEFPSPETLIKRLREDLQKVDVAFHFRSS
jgi:hypothetical protein